MPEPEGPGPFGASTLSRRAFLRTAAAAATLATSRHPLRAFADGRHPGLALRLGYAAITWQGSDEQAIDDISALGFPGIQLRASAFDRWGEKPQELKRLLEQKRLALLCLSSGNVDAVAEREKEHLETHARHAAFVAAVGGDMLQVISQRPKDRAPTTEEFERLGRLLNEIGRRTRDLGIRLVYHNHMNGFGEAPAEVDRVLAVTDRRYVSLLLDVAHYLQGGGDPVAAVSRYEERLGFLHLKDVVSPVPGEKGPARSSYQWVELGRGKVDLPGVVAALKKISFHGTGVIELDKVPDPGRTPKECAAYNKRYAMETLGLSLRGQ